MRAYRGQHAKGKQNKVPKKKIEGECDGYKLLFTKAFSYCNKWLAIGASIT
jgi:hypothetical protein